MADQHTTAVTTRELSIRDMPWVARMLRARRQRIQTAAPRFWKIAPEAEALHTAFLSKSIQDPENVAVATERGFAVGAKTPTHREVDDMAWESGEACLAEGPALILALKSHGDPLRVVAPCCEPERTKIVQDAGGVVRESWWNKDLDLVADPDLDRALPDVAGAKALMVDAPPVFAPGGPVLFFPAVTAPTEVPDVTEAATAMGAATSIIRQVADGDLTDDQIKALGYTKLTDFYWVV